MIRPSKEIHFYAYDTPNVSITNDWYWTKECIDDEKPIIRTMQMGLLSTRLFELGYRVFVHEGYKDFYEIRLGCENERTNREIKMGHDLFRLWKAGEFKIKESL